MAQVQYTGPFRIKKIPDRGWPINQKGEERKRKITMGPGLKREREGGEEQIKSKGRTALS